MGERLGRLEEALGKAMIHLEHPSQEIWDSRRSWFEQRAEPPENGGYLLSEQACALIADLQCAFCAGAWIAVNPACISLFPRGTQ